VARLWPCLQTLSALLPALNQQPLPWGVTGGVGFTLASGLDVLRTDSDLDLLLRSASPSDAAALRQVAALLQDQAVRVDVRVDVQVQTAAGAFALAEWTRTGAVVLLKTASGPVLSDDPWHPEPSLMAA
jgi:phosphoribosyl-dephospho-CoA transferase